MLFSLMHNMTAAVHRNALTYVLQKTKQKVKVSYYIYEKKYYLSRTLLYICSNIIGTLRLWTSRNSSVTNGKAFVKTNTVLHTVS